MRTNYLRHLANIIDILWSRPVGGGGGNPQLKHDAVLEVIDGQAIQ